MRNIKTSIIILLITASFGCSTKITETEDKRRFKNAIESSVDATSNKINPLIKEINISLNEGKSNKELENAYKECKLTVKLNKELVGSLTEVDSQINLKVQMLNYLDNCEKMLDNISFPLIQYLNESKSFDKTKIKEGLVLIQQVVKETQTMSESLENFCIKYELPREMEEFDKEDYKEKIEILKTKLEN